MTVFAKKTMPLRSWGALQDQMGLLQVTMGAPHDLMMLSTTSTDHKTDTIYIGLPDPALLPHFEGFEEIRQSELPDNMTTLVCRMDGFAEKFPDIERKRHGKQRR